MNRRCTRTSGLRTRHANSPHRTPTLWNSTPLAAIDSQDEQGIRAQGTGPEEPGQLVDASTADEWDISPKTANNQGSSNHSDGHIERPKPPTKTTRKPKKHLSQQGSNHRETRTLGNKPMRRQPEGKPSRARNRNHRRSAIYRIQRRAVRPRRKDNSQNQDKRKRQCRAPGNGPH